MRVDIGKLVGICEERGEKERNEMVKVGGEEDIYLDDKKRDKTALEKEAQNENGRERERDGERFECEMADRASIYIQTYR